MARQADPEVGKVEQRDFDEHEIEGRYIGRCDCCPSLLGEIDCHRDALVAAFWTWRGFNPGGSVREAVTRWAVDHWGDRPYRAALGVLVFAVEQTLDPSELESRRTYRVKPGSPQQRLESMGHAIDELLAKREMADAALSEERGA